MVLPVYAVTPFTMLDFPGKTACIVWLSGCNMRCRYCHNPEIVKGKGTKSIDSVFDFLAKRQGLLDGIVLSGGEATLYQDIIPFAQGAKSMGYAVKVDTNGTQPQKIKNMLGSDCLDYVALDYKAPESKFDHITARSDFSAFKQTLSLLLAQTNVPYEIRTTVHTSLLDEDDINAIIADLDGMGYTGTLYLQNFRADNDRHTLAGLKPQDRVLDKKKLILPRNFKLNFRNF